MLRRYFLRDRWVRAIGLQVGGEKASFGDHLSRNSDNKGLSRKNQKHNFELSSLSSSLSGVAVHLTSSRQQPNYKQKSTKKSRRYFPYITNPLVKNRQAISKIRPSRPACLLGREGAQPLRCAWTEDKTRGRTDESGACFIGLTLTTQRRRSHTYKHKQNT